LERPPLKERLNPSKTDKGGRLGDVADLALSKFGTGGKVASKVSLGSRIVERIRGSDADGDSDAGRGASRGGSQSNASSANGFAAGAPIPIQESIDVAVPVKTAFALCTRFAEYPEFLERVADVQEIDDSHVSFVAKLRGRQRELEIELLGEQPNERLDWECSEGIEHSGVITFHPLAPRLTRFELTVELEPHGLVERLARRAHLTERAIRDEMHRFKAYAELWEDVDEDELQDSEEPEHEEAQDEGLEDGEGEELVDEDDLEDEGELADQEDLDDQEDLEDEEYLEDEELEAAEDLDEDELDEDELEEEELEPARPGR